MPRRYLTAADVADLFQIKVDTVYELIRREGLPASKIGGQWRFDSDELGDWFRTQREDAGPDGREPQGVSSR